MEESGIFAEGMLPAAASGDGATLVRVGVHFSCYRVEHDGKYFFFKTFTTDTPLARRLLRREYELSAACDTPFMVHTFLYGEILPGKEGILMEYVDGRTLGEFMAENPSGAARRKVFEQLLQAVAYLHGRGIIHNDLKPDNILISRNGDNLRLTDLGLSDNDAHFLIKTPGCSDAYAAPELRLSRESDARSDIYSIGKIMPVIFGRRWRRISRKCTAEQSERRYGSVAALRRAWDRRNLPVKIAAAVAMVSALAVGAFSLAGEWNAERARTERLEATVELQAVENRQREEAYTLLKADYDGLNDSLERERMAAERHEKAVREREAEFKAGIRSRLLKTMGYMRGARDMMELVGMRQRFVTDVRAYYEGFDKTVDGEDIGPALHSLMISSFTESDLRLNRLQEQLLEEWNLLE